MTKRTPQLLTTNTAAAATTTTTTVHNATPIPFSFFCLLYTIFQGLAFQGAGLKLYGGARRASGALHKHSEGLLGQVATAGNEWGVGGGDGTKTGREGSRWGGFAGMGKH